MTYYKASIPCNAVTIVTTIVSNVTMVLKMKYYKASIPCNAVTTVTTIVLSVTMAQNIKYYNTISSIPYSAVTIVTTIVSSVVGALLARFTSLLGFPLLSRLMLFLLSYLMSCVLCILLGLQ